MDRLGVVGEYYNNGEVIRTLFAIVADEVLGKALIQHLQGKLLYALFSYFCLLDANEITPDILTWTGINSDYFNETLVFINVIQSCIDGLELSSEISKAHDFEHPIIKSIGVPDIKIHGANGILIPVRYLSSDDIIRLHDLERRKGFYTRRDSKEKSMYICFTPSAKYVHNMWCDPNSQTHQHFKLGA